MEATVKKMLTTDTMTVDQVVWHSYNVYRTHNPKVVCSNPTPATNLSPYHSDDYVSLFVPFVDIPVSLGNLFQRIASIYNRFYLSRFNNLLESSKDELQIQANNHTIKGLTYIKRANWPNCLPCLATWISPKL